MIVNICGLASHRDFINSNREGQNPSLGYFALLGLNDKSQVNLQYNKYW